MASLETVINHVNMLLGKFGTVLINTISWSLDVTSKVRVRACDSYLLALLKMASEQFHSGGRINAVTSQLLTKHFLFTMRASYLFLLAIHFVVFQIYSLKGS
jgi:hypothetical protein